MEFIYGSGFYSWISCLVSHLSSQYLFSTNLVILLCINDAVRSFTVIGHSGRSPLSRLFPARYPTIVVNFLHAFISMRRRLGKLKASTSRRDTIYCISSSFFFFFYMFICFIELNAVISVTYAWLMSSNMHQYSATYIHVCNSSQHQIYHLSFDFDLLFSTITDRIELEGAYTHH
jgi:hypothetical protein